MPRLLALAALLFAFPAHAEVTFDWVTVGDPGNPPDATGLGAVNVPYQISKYEVTYGQYGEFLNAVAKSDHNELYDTTMGGTFTEAISRSGSDGNYTYTVNPARQDHPVSYVLWVNALRFANWLHNGQPVGPQGPGTTENGAYFMGQGHTPDRLPKATFALASRNEWYKASYYDPNTQTYYLWSMGTDASPSCVPPNEDDGNSANCFTSAGSPPGTAPVGSYPLSASPYGTFDQTGNVSEFVDTPSPTSSHYTHGGSWTGNIYGNGSADDYGLEIPGSHSNKIGFRVVRITPSLPSLSPMGLLVVAAGLLGFSAYRRGRK